MWASMWANQRGNAGHVGNLPSENFLTEFSEVSERSMNALSNDCRAISMRFHDDSTKSTMRANLRDPAWSADCADSVERCRATPEPTLPSGAARTGERSGIRLHRSRTGVAPDRNTRNRSFQSLWCSPEHARHGLCTRLFTQSRQKAHSRMISGFSIL